jgi:hypothetical protein
LRTLSVGCDWPPVARIIRLVPATRTAREIMIWCPPLVTTVAVAMCPCREPIARLTRFFAALDTVTLTS